MHKKSTYDALKERNSPEYSCFEVFEPWVLTWGRESHVHWTWLPTLGLGNIYKFTYLLASAGFSFEVTGATLKIGFSRKWAYLRPWEYGKCWHAKHSFTAMNYPPPIPTAPPTHPPLSCLKHCSLGGYLEICFRFQNTPERGMAFQVANLGISTLGRMVLYGKCADLNVWLDHP